MSLDAYSPARNRLLHISVVALPEYRRKFRVPDLRGRALSWHERTGFDRSAYDSIEDEFAGITMPGELARWFRLAGYSDVRRKRTSISTRTPATLTMPPGAKSSFGRDDEIPLRDNRIHGLRAP
jgi:hypothetical protein